MVENNQRTSKLVIDEKLVMDMNPSELHELETVFKQIDKDKDGFINNDELLSAFHNLGYREITEKETMSILKEVDLNNNQKLEYQEFILMMKKFKKLGLKDEFKKFLNKDGQAQFRVEGTGSYSTFSEEEKIAYTKVINSVLAKDPDCAKLIPIHYDNMDLFPTLKNGIILCKLVNAAVPGTIDTRVINKKDNMNIFLCSENLRLALAAMKSIGIRVIGIDNTTIIEQKYTQILGILWQIIKQVLLKEISIKKHPQLIRLLKDGEELGDLLRLPPEDILKRWFNYHLDKAGYDKKLTNFSSDLKNSEKYTVLLNQLDPKRCDKAALNESDHRKRGQMVLDNAKKLGAESYITPDDICHGNEKLNLLFTAEIFNNFHGLDELNEEEFEKCKMLDDDAEGSREERAYRMWINSMGIDGVHVNNLYEDCRSGILLLKVIDRIKPGTVNWKKVELEPKNNFAKMVNCNEAVDASKRLGLTIVGIAGRDIHEPNRKLILAIVWQLMRESTLQILGNKTENDIVEWANTMAKLDPPLKTFSDKRLSDSLFFIDIISAIEPRAIDWDIVRKDTDAADAKENNAKYTISLARKLGATIFLVWEDITEVKPKMCLTFTAGLYEVWRLESKLKGEKKKIADEEGLKTNVGLTD